MYLSLQDLRENYCRSSPRHCLRLAWPRFCRATAKGAASLTRQGKWHSSLACHCSWRGKARLPRHPSRHGKAWTFPVDQSRASSTYVQHKQNKMREYNRLDISLTHAQVFKLLHKTWFVWHDTLLHNTWSKLISWPHKFDQVHKLVRRSSITSATST